MKMKMKSPPFRATNSGAPRQMVPLGRRWGYFEVSLGKIKMNRPFIGRTSSTRARARDREREINPAALVSAGTKPR